MRGATAQLLYTAQLAGEQLQRNQPVGGLSEELYTKTQIFKKNLLFHYSLDISLLKHQRLEPQPHWQRSPRGEPCTLGKLRWEVQNRTTRLVEENLARRAAATGRERVTRAQKAKLGMI